LINEKEKKKLTTPHANGNGNSAKHLMWIGGAIVVCVTVSTFLFGLRQLMANNAHAMLDEKCKMRSENVGRELNHIIEILNELRCDVKKHIDSEGR
jgi:hypothetical protein